MWSPKYTHETPKFPMWHLSSSLTWNKLCDKNILCAHRFPNKARKLLRAAENWRVRFFHHLAINGLFGLVALFSPNGETQKAPNYVTQKCNQKANENARCPTKKSIFSIVKKGRTILNLKISLGFVNHVFEAHSIPSPQFACFCTHFSAHHLPALRFKT